MNRRDALLGLLASAAAPIAWSAGWPDKPIRLIVPSAPTTPGDAVARAISDLLQGAIGQPLVIDNRSGAQGFIGLEAVAKAPSDGYTFGILNIQQAIIPAMRSNMPFRITEVLQPVIQLTTEATVLVVGAQLPVASLDEFIAYAKQHPNQLSYGSSGNGSPSHVGMELLRRTAGLQIQHVPYRSPSAVLNDIAGGQLQLGLLNSAAVIPMVAGGKVRALAVSSDKRLARLPQVPSFAEAGLKGVDLRGWVGIVAPAGTDTSIVARMNAELNRVLESPQAQERLRSAGSEPAGGTAAQFARHIASETDRWRHVVVSARIRMD